MEEGKGKRSGMHDEAFFSILYKPEMIERRGLVERVGKPGAGDTCGVGEGTCPIRDWGRGPTSSFYFFYLFFHALYADLSF